MNPLAVLPSDLQCSQHYCVFIAIVLMLLPPYKDLVISSVWLDNVVDVSMIALVAAYFPLSRLAICLDIAWNIGAFEHNERQSSWMLDVACNMPCHAVTWGYHLSPFAAAPGWCHRNVTTSELHKSAAQHSTDIMLSLMLWHVTISSSKD